MYNLVVSANEESFEGEPHSLKLDRCVREYTDAYLEARFKDLGVEQIAELAQLPTILAYENSCRKAPKFGRLLDITYRRAQATVRLEYEVIAVNPFISHQQLAELRFELDIGEYELNRSHWAVKDVDLPKELRRVGVDLPDWTGRIGKAVDITKHAFEVGLSFPGEERPLVEAVAKNLARLLGPDRYFYDNNYVAQLARPNLDVLLQSIYRERSKLVVAFVGQAYQAKDWCGIEWRAIRQILAERRDEGRIMFVRVDDGEVDGIFRTDGYVDARKFSADAIAEMIVERAALL